jgi:hypothetical protein
MVLASRGAAILVNDLEGVDDVVEEITAGGVAVGDAAPSLSRPTVVRASGHM